MSPGRASLLILACFAAGGPPASALAGERAISPPSAGSLREQTRDLLRTAPFSGPAGSARRSGGIAVGGGPATPGRGLFPGKRLLTLYGAPQLPSTILGRLSPNAAARKVVRQVRPYAKLSDRRIIPGFDLIAVVANSTAGPDRKYRTRQPDRLIRSYLRAVRSVNGRLVLDIQPGRASVIDEVDALEDWIAKPDVDVSLDPEWEVGPRGVPGRTVGKIRAGELNRVSRRIQEIVADHDLPPKALVVHQFRSGSVRDRDQIRQRRGVDVTLSFDGIGSPAAKKAGYVSLSADSAFSGFSIFYSLDTRVMSPRSVLGLRPEPDFLLFQ